MKYSADRSTATFTSFSSSQSRKESAFWDSSRSSSNSQSSKADQKNQRQTDARVPVVRPYLASLCSWSSVRLPCSSSLLICLALASSGGWLSCARMSSRMLQTSSSRARNRKLKKLDQLQMQSCSQRSSHILLKFFSSISVHLIWQNRKACSFFSGSFCLSPLTSCPISDCLIFLTRVCLRDLPWGMAFYLPLLQNQWKRRARSSQQAGFCLMSYSVSMIQIQLAMQYLLQARRSQIVQEIRKTSVAKALNSARRINFDAVPPTRLDFSHEERQFRLKAITDAPGRTEMLAQMDKCKSDFFNGLSSSQINQLLLQIVRLFQQGVIQSSLSDFTRQLFFDVTASINYNQPMVARLVAALQGHLHAPPADLRQYERILAITANISCNKALHMLVTDIPLIVLPHLRQAWPRESTDNLERIYSVLLYNLCKFVEQEGGARSLCKVLSKLVIYQGSDYRMRLVRLLNPTRFLAVKFPDVIEMAGGFPFMLLETITYITRSQDHHEWGQFLLALIHVHRAKSIFCKECHFVSDWMLEQIREESDSAAYCLVGMAKLARLPQFYQFVDFHSLLVECMDRGTDSYQKIKLLEALSERVCRLPNFVQDLLFQAIVDALLENSQIVRQSKTLLTSLMNLLQEWVQSGRQEAYVDRLYTTGVAKIIEGLQDSPSEEVFGLAQRIIERFLSR